MSFRIDLRVREGETGFGTTDAGGSAEVDELLGVASVVVTEVVASVVGVVVVVSGVDVTGGEGIVVSAVVDSVFGVVSVAGDSVVDVEWLSDGSGIGVVVTGVSTGASEAFSPTVAFMDSSAGSFTGDCS